MIIKCKMCGGDIEFTPGATYGTCEYCGSTSTIPQANDEQKLNRYNRANHYRRQCEFDKAVSAYEKILEQDDQDAEAHWGAVLSRFGIEYVEDPTTKQRIPTCHRVQIASILADADYLAAVAHAPDAESRRLYEAQATQIAEIQKGILAISANETPYDVFICYKETDAKGQRTRDSQWAQDVYYGLTDAGYKVFFSRITLEDKLGQQYEPYIFAALNSARVMVVIGSKPEYFNAVWVKNEWSRYLALMAGDRKRLLIPCYRDMDPYDLPEELSTLQSQDMSKIGFMQDLLRGVKKVLVADSTSEVPQVIQQVQVTQTSADATPGVTSLIERAYLFMEDNDYNSAEEYLNRVLDIAPKHAPAYAAKVCATLHLKKESELAETAYLYEDNTDWQKVLRFADATQKAVYEGYIAKVRDRVKQQIRQYAIDCAVEMAVNPQANQNELTNSLNKYQHNSTHSRNPGFRGQRRKNACLNEDAFLKAVQTNDPGEVSETNLKTAADMFKQIQDAEALQRSKQCLVLAEQARQRDIYQHATASYRVNSTSAIALDNIADFYESIPTYRDAQQLAEKCKAQAESIRKNLYEAATKAMSEAGNQSEKWHAVHQQLSNDELHDYRDVATLRERAKQREDECQAAEREVAQRKAEEEREIARRKAEENARKRKRICIISTSAAALVLAIVYVVTQIIIPNGHYNTAVQLRANGQYAEAVAAFASLENYRDAKAQITETNYQHAQQLIADHDYDNAATILISIKGYKDVDNMLENDENLVAAAARDAKFAVGNYVEFGTYPQTATGTDETPIEWLVLARDGNHALLISRYGLDAKPYNTTYESTTWEKCTLRTWLNKDFLNRAFSANEQSAILLTNVDNSSKQCYSSWSTSGGNNTQDKIFLLSYAEANQYLNVTYSDSNNQKSRVAPTAYAKKNGAYTSSSNTTQDGEASGWWWLRSPGSRQNYAASVYSVGSLDFRRVSSAHASVRPALWVNLESGIF